VGFFSFKVIFILSELEGVDLFQYTLPSNLTSTNWSTVFGSITFDSNQQRSFMYSFIGRQCNGSWTSLKDLNSAFINVNTLSNTCFNYPTGDTTTTGDSGKLISMSKKKKIKYLFNFYRLGYSSYCSFFIFGCSYCMCCCAYSFLCYPVSRGKYKKIQKKNIFL
jgi:hypothetical protein